MTDTSRFDPEMLAFQAARDADAAQYPPLQVGFPFEPQRAVNDALNLITAQGGPVPAEMRDGWVAARGRRIFCRLYRPSAAKNLPLVVYFHGGGWVWSSVDTHDRLAREICTGSGMAVLSVDYALSPEAKFPQAMLECAAVTEYAAGAGAAEWGIDPARLFVAGDSAGANLALATALALRDRKGPALTGIVAFYPVCDADFTRPSYRDFATGYGLSRERMEFYWNVYVPHEADRSHPLAAPLHADLAGLPPVLVQLAELDVLRSEGEALVEKLRAAGVAVSHETFAGVVHGFLRATSGVAKARKAVAGACDFLRAQLQR